ncbi:MAG: helix-turn-helix domain-containing protein [Bacteroidota bacterium]
MPKYKTTHHTPRKSIKIKTRLLHVFTSEKIYQNNKLSLPLLAKQLQTNTKYLSQVINQHYHQNFTTFINTHRIQAFQQKLLDGQAQKLTLFGLAQECGFHNRSTFYRAFRNHTGQSPKQFLQEQQ